MSKHQRPRLTGAGQSTSKQIQQTSLCPTDPIPLTDMSMYVPTPAASALAASESLRPCIDTEDINCTINAPGLSLKPCIDTGDINRTMNENNNPRPTLMNQFRPQDNLLMIPKTLKTYREDIIAQHGGWSSALFSNRDSILLQDPIEFIPLMLSARKEDGEHIETIRPKPVLTTYMKDRQFQRDMTDYTRRRKMTLYSESLK